MTKQAVSVVLVGCGGMANAWINAAQAYPDVRIVGLVDVRREAAEAMAQRYNLDAGIVYNSLAEAIAGAKPDAVFDVTIPEAHDKVVTEALRAGCHVLGEKPMTVSLPQAQAMVRTAAETGKIYAVTQNYRYRPEIRTFRSVLQGDAIGAVEELHAEFYLGPHFGGFRDEMDFPLILDMAIHTFDAARYLSGADPVSVYCHAFNPKRSWYKGDASSIAIFEMSDGVVFTYRGSWCAEGLSTPWNSAWRAIGSRGSARWNGDTEIVAQAVEDPSSTAWMRDVRDVPVTPVTMEHTSHAALMRDFVAAIREGTQPETAAADNIKSLAMVLAAVESARSGQRVKVQW